MGGHVVRSVTVGEAEGAFAEFGPDVVIALIVTAREEREPSSLPGRLAEAVREGAIRYLPCAPPVNMEELRQALRD